jgi:hypothetical protein
MRLSRLKDRDKSGIAIEVTSPGSKHELGSRRPRAELKAGKTQGVTAAETVRPEKTKPKSRVSDV